MAKQTGPPGTPKRKPTVKKTPKSRGEQIREHAREVSAPRRAPKTLPSYELRFEDQKVRAPVSHASDIGKVVRSRDTKKAQRVERMGRESMEYRRGKGHPKAAPKKRRSKSRNVAHGS